MTTIFTLGLRDKVTYWAPGASDRYGARSMGAPVAMNGRWEEGVTKFKDAATGDDILSTTSVLTELDCEIGGYLANGEQSGPDPTAVPGAYEIKAVVRTPNLAQTAVGYRCLL